MFTGIIEAQARIEELTHKQEILHLSLESKLSKEFYVGQSVAHNGVCLTIERASDRQYEVSIIAETLSKTNLKLWELGTLVNIERALKIHSRLDGHFVQGHVDTCGLILEKNEIEKNIHFDISYPKTFENLVIPQGSIAVDGISLTIAKDFTHPKKEACCFRVCLIPHSLENTTAQYWEKGTQVNIEFDMLGKYINKLYRKKL